MSPILVRPVREQLEHDRVIRLLQQDLQKRKVEVGINPGAEQNAAVGVGSRKEYPDAVVYALEEKGKKVVAVIEVETSESVNHLEAMAQWAHLAKLRVPFHLYVPMNSVDVARRLAHDYKITVTEIWSYHQAGEQFRFTPIHPTSARGGRGSTPPPRTVSVASIRVALPPDPDPAGAEEPVIQSGTAPVPPTAPPSKTTGVKTIPARVVAPAALQTKPGKAPRVVPARVASPAPTKLAAAKAAPERRALPEKQSGTKPGQPKSAVAKPVAAKRPTTGVAAKGTAASKTAPAKPSPRPVKTVAKATAKPSGKVTTRALQSKPVQGRPAGKSTGSRSPIRGTKTAKPALKGGAKPAKRK